MHPIAYRLMVIAASALALGLAGYAGFRLTDAHARPRRHSRVMFLGTITVTPRDTARRAALATRAMIPDRYAHYAQQPDTRSG